MVWNREYRKDIGRYTFRSLRERVVFAGCGVRVVGTKEIERGMIEWRR